MGHLDETCSAFPACNLLITFDWTPDSLLPNANIIITHSYQHSAQHHSRQPPPLVRSARVRVRNPALTPAVLVILHSRPALEILQQLSQSDTASHATGFADHVHPPGTVVHTRPAVLTQERGKRSADYEWPNPSSRRRHSDSDSDSGSGRLKKENARALASVLTFWGNFDVQKCPRCVELDVKMNSARQTWMLQARRMEGIQAEDGIGEIKKIYSSKRIPDAESRQHWSWVLSRMHLCNHT